MTMLMNFLRVCKEVLLNNIKVNILWHGEQ